MAYLTKAEMRTRGNRILLEQQRLGKSTCDILAEATSFDPQKTYDVFLSHRSRDKPLVVGVKDRLEDEHPDPKPPKRARRFQYVLAFETGCHPRPGHEGWLHLHVQFFGLGSIDLEAMRRLWREIAWIHS